MGASLGHSDHAGTDGVAGVNTIDKLATICGIVADRAYQNSSIRWSNFLGDLKRLIQRRTEPNAVLIDNSDAARQISDKARLRQESCEHGHYLRSGEVIWKA